MLAVLSALEAIKMDLSTRALTEPKKDPFEHGVQVGMYNGVQASIDKINELREPKATQPTGERQAVYS